MRCTCGKPGTITLPRRAFPYCEECFRHTIVRLFRHEIGDGPVHLRPNAKPNASTPRNHYYREAVEALAREARRDIVESAAGALPGCTERAAVEATLFLFGETPKPETIIPATITHEELERFFKPAPAETRDAIERDLNALEERYPGTLASVIKSAHDRVKEPQ